MRFIQVATHYADIGGGPRMIHDLAALLFRFGHDIKILYGAPIDRPFRDVQWPMHQVAGVLGRDSAPGANTVQTLRHEVAEFSPDLVVFHGPIHPALVDSVGASWPVVKFVHAYHDCPAHRRLFTRGDRVCEKVIGPGCLVNWYARKCGTGRRDPRFAISSFRSAWQETQSLRRAPVVLTNSEYLKRSLVSSGCVPSGVHVVPLFSMDLPVATQPTIVGRTGSEGTNDRSCAERTVLFAGRLGYEKGLPYLLRAFARLAPMARLVIAGDGHMEGKCREMARILNIADRTRFLGWVPAPEMSAIYSAADVLAVPSIWPEPFGLIGIEAARFGCPVVAFDVGGIGEWLGSLVRGTAVPALDEGAFAEALDHYLGASTDRAQAVEDFYVANQRRMSSALSLFEELAQNEGQFCRKTGNGAP